MKIITIISALLLLGLSGCVSNKVEKPKPDPSKIAAINVQLAAKYMQLGNSKEALNKLNIATEADPNNADAQRAIGQLYSQLGQMDSADTAFARSIQLEQDNAIALYQYGQFKCDRGLYEDAMSLFNRSLAVPTFNQRWLPLSAAGQCAIKDNKLAQAEQFLRQALSLKPNYSFALLEMADIEFRKQNYQGTSAYIKQLGKRARHSPRSLWLGILASRQLQDKNAIASYSLALRNKFPGSKEAKLLESQ